MFSRIWRSILSGKSKWVLLLLIVVLFSSCSSKSTLPGANSVSGTVDGAGYAYHYWEEGLAIFMWHDFTPGSQFCSGTASTDDPVYRLKCDAQTLDGRQFNWEIHSSDSVTGDLWIDGERYDLDRGAMFLVSTQNDATDIVQVKVDLSGLEADNDMILAFARENSDIANFIGNIETP